MDDGEELEKLKKELKEELKAIEEERILKIEALDVVYKKLELMCEHDWVSEYEGWYCSKCFASSRGVRYGQN